MKIKPKYIVASVIGLVSISAALLYLEYKKLMSYTLKLSKIKNIDISANKISFNLFLNFKNNSKLKFNIDEQTYNIYVNDVFITTAKNYSSNQILPNSTSVIGINISFAPKTALSAVSNNLADFLLHPEKVKIKAEINLKVSLYGMKFSIPYLYEATIQDIKNYKNSSDN